MERLRASLIVLLALAAASDASLQVEHSLDGGKSFNHAGVIKMTRTVRSITHDSV
jgi:hypothetical protein